MTISNPSRPSYAWCQSSPAHFRVQGSGPRVGGFGPGLPDRAPCSSLDRVREVSGRRLRLFRRTWAPSFAPLVGKILTSLERAKTTAKNLSSGLMAMAAPWSSSGLKVSCAVGGRTAMFHSITFLSSPALHIILPVMLTREQVISPVCPLHTKRHCGCFLSSFLPFLPPAGCFFAASGLASCGAAFAGGGCVRADEPIASARATQRGVWNGTSGRARWTGSAGRTRHA